MADVIHLGDWQLQPMQQREDSGRDARDHKHIKLAHRGAIVRCKKGDVQVPVFWGLEILSEE